MKDKNAFFDRIEKAAEKGRKQEEIAKLVEEIKSIESPSLSEMIDMSSSTSRDEDRLKELSECDGGAYDEGSPLKNIGVGDYPTEKEILEFFKQQREEYPKYSEFEFEVDSEQTGCSCCAGDSHTHTWYLVGVRPVKQVVLEELKEGKRDLGECLTSSCLFTREAAKEFEDEA